MDEKDKKAEEEEDKKRLNIDGVIPAVSGRHDGLM